MADTKITALAAISTIDVNPATSPIPIVDLLDNSMAASGTTKKVTVNQILGAGGTATLASATITGDLTVRTTGLVVGSTATGIGTTPNTWSGAWKAAQVGRLTLGNATTDSLIGHNFYNDGSYRFAANDFASYYDQVGGGHIWGSSVTSGTAGNAIGWTVLATLNATGLGVGGSPVSGMLLTVGSTSSVSATANALQVLSNKGTFNVVTDGSTNAAGTTITYSWANGGQGPLIFRNAAISNVMTLDSSGNVGIGVTPSAWNSSYKAIEIGSNGPALSFAGGIADLNQNAFFNASNQWVFKTAASSTLYRQQSGQHQWFRSTNVTPSAGGVITFDQAMTLDASGNLLVGQTTAALDAQGGFYFRNAAASGGSSMIVNHRSAVTGGNSYAEFTYNGVGIGSITQSGTTGVAFNATSDYRLKEAVQPITGALSRISALKPSIYKWKVDGSSGEGFLAHELAEAVPLAVTGDKDAVNEDGSIKPQQVDLSKVVPVLVAAIQELTARVQTLEAK